MLCSWVQVAVSASMQKGWIDICTVFAQSPVEDGRLGKLQFAGYYGFESAKVRKPGNVRSEFMAEIEKGA